MKTNTFPNVPNFLLKNADLFAVTTLVFNQWHDFLSFQFAIIRLEPSSTLNARQKKNTQLTEEISHKTRCNFASYIQMSLYAAREACNTSPPNKEWQ